MRIYLAGIEVSINSIYNTLLKNINQIHVLSSFFYIKNCNSKEYSKLFPLYKDFMLDSGAFTFMKNNKTLNWDKYLEEYANYIKEKDVKKYFELDIDSIVGYEKVKEYRARLERITNRPCIPVWHRSRGYNEFLRLCDEYNYIAIGGIAIKHILPSEYKYFNCFISEAHKRNCKIHGLGFTSLSLLKKYHFDSVDSTSWTAGNRFGYIYNFDNKIMKKEQVSGGKTGRRISNYKGVAEHNLLQWIKFQKYAEVFL